MGRLELRGEKRDEGPLWKIAHDGVGKPEPVRCPNSFYASDDEMLSEGEQRTRAKINLQPGDVNLVGVDESALAARIKIANGDLPIPESPVTAKWITDKQSHLWFVHGIHRNSPW